MKDALTKENLTVLREAIRQQKKICFEYHSQKGKHSQEIVWPFTIGYFTDGRILVAWSESENNYRHFNTSGITSVKILTDTFKKARDSLFHEWQALQFEKLSKKNKKNL